MPNNARLKAILEKTQSVTPPISFDVHNASSDKTMQEGIITDKTSKQYYFLFDCDNNEIKITPLQNSKSFDEFVNQDNEKLSFPEEDLLDQESYELPPMEEVAREAMEDWKQSSPETFKDILETEPQANGE